MRPPEHWGIADGAGAGGWAGGLGWGWAGALVGAGAGATTGVVAGAGPRVWVRAEAGARSCVS